ncbi:MAG: hypothetical protein GY862_22545 [Gammaproteobacteria bacterium]|nr:hypothetical protein [Gammaproteobacteria bacterium]
MLYGNAETVAGKIYSEQPYTAYKDSLIPLPGILDTAYESLAVTNEAGDATYAKNTDYYAEAGGIVIPGTGAIAGDDSGNGTPVKITFKTAAADVIQALTNSGDEYYARFVSENAARANKKEIADFFRVKFQIIKEMTLTDSGGHKKAAVTLTILADDSRDFNGGLSQHMTIYRGP